MMISMNYMPLMNHLLQLKHVVNLSFILASKPHLNCNHKNSRLMHTLVLLLIAGPTRQVRVPCTELLHQPAPEGRVAIQSE